MWGYQSSLVARLAALLHRNGHRAGPDREETTMVLVRHLLGEVLRAERVSQGRTLRDVSKQAMVSLGYLSEIERGVKEASSECLWAICSALDVPLSAVVHTVSLQLSREEGTATVAPLTAVDAARLPDVVAAA